MVEGHEKLPRYSVEFALNVEGEGLTALCCFPDPPQASIRAGDPVEFIRPDQSVVRTTVRALSMMMDARPGLIGLVLPEAVQKDDIPLGRMLRLVRPGGRTGIERR